MRDLQEKVEKMKSENKTFIEEMVALQIELAVWVKENTNLKCHTYGDLERILTGRYYTQTYVGAVACLVENYKICSDVNLLKRVGELHTNIALLDIRNLRFGQNPHKPFTAIEKEYGFFKHKTLFNTLKDKDWA